MSEWYEVTEDDIDIDFHDKEVSFFVKQNNSGSVYLSLSFDQIKGLFETINKADEAKNCSSES